jgi:hypothetical protein
MEKRTASDSRFSGTIEGISFTEQYTYENVIVRMYGARSVGMPGDKVIIIKWPKRPCGEAQAVSR